MASRGHSLRFNFFLFSSTPCHFSHNGWKILGHTEFALREMRNGEARPVYMMELSRAVSYEEAIRCRSPESGGSGAICFSSPSRLPRTVARVLVFLVFVPA
jgi:hypothetical protein